MADEEEARMLWNLGQERLILHRFDRLVPPWQQAPIGEELLESALADAIVATCYAPRSVQFNHSASRLYRMERVLTVPL